MAAPDRGQVACWPTECLTIPVVVQGVAQCDPCCSTFSTSLSLLLLLLSCKQLCYCTSGSGLVRLVVFVLALVPNLHLANADALRCVVQKCGWQSPCTNLHLTSLTRSSLDRCGLQESCCAVVFPPILFDRFELCTLVCILIPGSQKVNGATEGALTSGATSQAAFISSRHRRFC